MPKFTSKLIGAANIASGVQKVSIPTVAKPSTSGATPAIVKQETKKPSIFNKMKDEAKSVLHKVEVAAPIALDKTEHFASQALSGAEKIVSVPYHELVKGAKAVESDVGGLLSSPVNFLTKNILIFGVLGVGSLYLLSKANQPALSNLASNTRLIL